MLAMGCEVVGGGWYVHLGLGLWCYLCQGLLLTFVFFVASWCCMEAGWGAVFRGELSHPTPAGADS